MRVRTAHPVIKTHGPRLRRICLVPNSHLSTPHRSPPEPPSAGLSGWCFRAPTVSVRNSTAPTSSPWGDLKNPFERGLGGLQALLERFYTGIDVFLLDDQRGLEADYLRVVEPEGGEDAARS